MGSFSLQVGLPNFKICFEHGNLLSSGACCLVSSSDQLMLFETGVSNAICNAGGGAAGPASLIEDAGYSALYDEVLRPPAELQGRPSPLRMIDFHIARECGVHMHRQGLERGNIPFATALTTGAHDLQQYGTQHIIHVVVPWWPKVPDQSLVGLQRKRAATEYASHLDNATRDLQRCVVSVLREACSVRAETVAMPILCAGAQGAQADHVLRTLLNTLHTELLRLHGGHLPNSGPMMSEAVLPCSVQTVRIIEFSKDKYNAVFDEARQLMQAFLGADQHGVVTHQTQHVPMEPMPQRQPPQLVDVQQQQQWQQQQQQQQQQCQQLHQQQQQQQLQQQQLQQEQRRLLAMEQQRLQGPTAAPDRARRISPFGPQTLVPTPGHDASPSSSVAAQGPDTPHVPHAPAAMDVSVESPPPAPDALVSQLAGSVTVPIVRFQAGNVFVYDNLEPIVHGGFGYVMLCTYTGKADVQCRPEAPGNPEYVLRPQQRVALKSLKSKLYESKAQAREKLQEEASIHCRLTHPNISTCLCLAELEDRRMYMVMRFYPDTLYDLSDKPGITVAKRRQIAIQLAEALKYLHDPDTPSLTYFIHRDLKPNNVLLDADHNVKLTDFGLSQELDASHAHTYEGDGCIDWMAPELLGDAGPGRDYNLKVDVYAYGIILYQLVTWRLREPWMHWQPKESLEGLQPKCRSKRRNELLRDDLHKGLCILPPEGSQHCMHLDPDLEGLIKLCTELDPDDRPVMDEVLRKLRASSWGRETGQDDVSTSSAADTASPPRSGSEATMSYTDTKELAVIHPSVSMSATTSSPPNASSADSAADPNNNMAMRS